jgi:hypothetical protein
MGNRVNNEIYPKLEGFIKKYYKNRIIKGSLLSISLLLAFYLLVVTLEFYGRYSGGVRLGLLVSFVAGASFILARFIALPFFALVRIGKRLSFEEASRVIGSHFPEVQDKLINILQLDKVSDTDNSLVLASIEQKTTELKPIDFRSAIDYKRNRKYLKFLIPVFVVFGLVCIAFPSIINLGTRRIVQYNKVFKTQFPFQILLDAPLEAVVGEDYLLSFHLEGRELPEKILIEYDNKRYKADDLNKKKYSFLFANVKKDVPFKIIADGEEYDVYSLKAISKPSIRSVSVVADYPDYLNMKDEVLVNPSDMTLPEGTKLTWNIMADNTTGLKVYKEDSAFVLNGAGKYNFGYRVMQSDFVSLLPVNTGNKLLIKDSLSTSISVIPDMYPSIEVAEARDSVFLSLLTFDGEIKDDYGLRSLKFHYTVYNDEKEGDKNVITIPISGGLVAQGFNYPFDTKLLNMGPGDKMVYFFEVFDNDGVRGSKSTRSQIMTFAIPTEKQINEAINKRNENIKDDLSDSKSMSDDLQKQIDELQKALLQKKELSWDDKKKLADILEKQQELKNKMDDVQKNNEMNDIQKQELSDDEKRLLDKQDQIDKLFDELNNDDLNKMMEEMEKLMDKMDKNKMMDALDKMELTNKDLEKELDRTLALFKEMQFENKLQDAMDKLDELMKQQDEFMKDAEDKKVDENELKKQQDALDEMMKEVKEDIDKLQEMNKELEDKKEMDGLNEKMEEMQNEMNNSKQEMGNGQKSKSSKSMSKAKSKTKEMKDQLSGMQQQMEQESKEENLEDLRQLLDNTLKLSFDQEALINNTNGTNVSNPQFKDILKEQKKLIDDSKVIEDSLLALSKRVIEIQSMVNREITMVKSSMEKSLEQLVDRNKGTAVQKQQYALTSLNNLALLLSEAIKQMQQQMMSQQESKGSKSCSKPGNSNPNMDGLIQKQMGLQKKLMDLQGKMKGEVPKNGENGDIAKDLVKLANEQEGIRKELQDLSKNLEGDQKKQINDIIKKMEENEQDILNKRISSQTLDRNEEIKIKMMDSEKALRNQDQNENRKSNEGIDKKDNNNQVVEDYFKKKSLELEIIRTIPPVMRPYYKSKVSQYLNNF